MMKLILKTILLILVVSPVVSSQDIEISIPSISGSPGDAVVIPISISDTTGMEITSVEIRLQYDPAILTAVTGTAGIDRSGIIAGSWLIDSNTGTPGQISIGMIGMKPLTGSGVLVKIKFSVQPDAKIASKSPLKIVEAITNDKPVAKARDGLFTVVVPVGQRLEGDINGDNRVDYMDLLKLILTYNKSKGDSGYDPEADLNKDERVDKADMMILWRNYGSTR